MRHLRIVDNKPLKKLVKYKTAIIAYVTKHPNELIRWTEHQHAPIMVQIRKHDNTVVQCVDPRWLTNEI